MNLAIGETTAEQIKIQIGCAMPLMTDIEIEVRGRDLTDGLPRNVKKHINVLTFFILSYIIKIALNK